MFVITYPCPNLTQSLLAKWVSGNDIDILIIINDSVFQLHIVSCNCCFISALRYRVIWKVSTVSVAAFTDRRPAYDISFSFTNYSRLGLKKLFPITHCVAHLKANLITWWHVSFALAVTPLRYVTLSNLIHWCRGCCAKTLNVQSFFADWYLHLSL